MKFIFVFLVFAGLASCSNDDDSNETPGTDRIVGKWKIQQFLLDGEQIPLTDCEKQSTIEFMTNGTARTIDFFDDPDTNQCVSETYTEQWVNRGNNVYRFTEGGFSYDVTIIFSNNNNSFTITAEDEFETYTATYIRV